MAFRHALALMAPIAAAAGVLLLSRAHAEPTRDQEACFDVLQKSLRRVSLATGKEFERCLRDAAKGKLGVGTVSGCVAEDRTRGIGRARAKTRRDFHARCEGLDPDGKPRLPELAPTDPDAVSAAAIEEQHALVAAVLGPDPDDALIGARDDRNGFRCQQLVAKGLQKCHAARAEQITRCRQVGPGQASLPGPQRRVSCVAQGRTDEVARLCGAKLEARVRKKCTVRAVALSTVIPGCVTDDPAALAACLDRVIACQLCEALAVVEGQPRDCDTLDDGIRNGSCGADGCEVLNASECYLPYPSTHFLVPADTETGFRVDLPQAGMPRVNGPQTRVDPYNEVDGFSPMAHALMHFPQGVDPVRSRAARLLAPGCCGQPQGPPWIDTRTTDSRSLEPDSPSVLMDARTGERILHFVETDANAESTARQVVFLRPGRSLRPGRRYIIAMRDLVDPSGDAVRPEPAFAALRDGIPTTIPAIERRRAYMDEQVFSVLESHGVPRANLVLAFDFVTQSERQLTHQMLAMRDDAYAWVAGTAADADAVPFAVENVVTNDCNAPGTVVWREVSGTFESPLYLSEDPDLQGIARLVVDADGTPVRSGIVHPPFGISIPCRVLDADETIYPLYLGHGFLGSGLDMVQGTPDIIASAADWNYIAGGTNWSGFSSADLSWLIDNIVGTDGLSRLNNYPALPDRVRQAMVNALVLTRMMKLRMFNRHPAFRTPSGAGVFPGPDAEIFYYGVSLGGIMGMWMSALTPDIIRFALDVPTLNFISCLTQRSSAFGPFASVLATIGLADPMQRALMLAVQSELFVSAEAAGYAYHITRDPLPGSGTAKHILMLPAWLDKQVPNICTEISARTLGLATLAGSIQQGLQGIPDLAGPLDSALVTWDTGAFDLFEPLHAPFIPPLENLVPNGVCDPHGARRRIPAGILQLVRFLQPGGRVENLCVGPGSLCDADRPFEIAGGAAAACDPVD